MSDIVSAAIKAVNSSRTAFAKFLSPNDTGLTGGHQCGIYIPHQATTLIFNAPCERGRNRKRDARILWNDRIETMSAFTYYGQGTRNEYRITRFGRGFEYLKPTHTGDLVIICRMDDVHYRAYELSTDEEIESFLNAFSLSATELNALIKDELEERPSEDSVFEYFFAQFGNDFPDTRLMALSAREAHMMLNGELTLDPDSKILGWIDTEYRLFRYIERRHYRSLSEHPPTTLDEIVAIGLEITNRRKARAGKSLEHHLATIFDEHELRYTAQAVTEGKKKPDFIFPSAHAYHDETYPSDALIFLGAKTTCKDRWRQILNEADRIPHKYLFTLQQGISDAQLDEMRAEGVTLVVPARYHSAYPPEKRSALMTLQEFIEMATNNQQRASRILL